MTTKMPMGGMNTTGMDHSGMDHSGMDHGGMNTTGMDHSGMDHGSMPMMMQVIIVSDLKGLAIVFALPPVIN
jgi:uncharacterized protein involved in copper resistance